MWRRMNKCAIIYNMLPVERVFSFDAAMMQNDALRMGCVKMQEKTRQTTAGRGKHRKYHTARKGYVRITAVFAVLCAALSLVMPAFALEGPCKLEHEHNATCGITDEMMQELEGKTLHVHDAFCRDREGNVICPLPELAVHTHSEDCYEIIQPETVPAGQGHIHGDACYTSQRGSLTCTVSEENNHTHTDACYQTVVPGDKAHKHTEDCYAVRKGNLTCTETEREGHAHGEGCYVLGSEPVCGVEEGEEHSHSGSCYGKILACKIPEITGHCHSDDCFAWEKVLICSQEESAGETGPSEPVKILVCQKQEQNIHVHGSSCYGTDEVLVCGKSEDGQHIHGDSCYGKELICEREGHGHTAACYQWMKVLVCSLEEQAPAEPEKVLVCTRPELIVHTHRDSCYEGDRTVCGMYQMHTHQHTQDCLAFSDEALLCTAEESDGHKHSYLCYGSWSFLCQGAEEPADKPDDKEKSDPTADVETRADWEKTFSHVKLTGAWAQDLLAIAQTQLGYEESERNFIVYKNGDKKGYTRYGDWYGGQYGDWCAMFASFCLNYARVKDFPQQCNCCYWVSVLQEAGMYAAAETYTPKPGDLVFIDYKRKSITPKDIPLDPEHVGIVYEVIPATKDKPAELVTIEGNYSDRVCYVTRQLENPIIIGYGVLPDGPSAVYSCGLECHTHVVGCFDDEGKTACRTQTHSHNEDCRSRQLWYEDEKISVAVKLTNAVYLPGDLQLRAALVPEDDPSRGALAAAVEDAVPEKSYTVEDALFCRMELLSGGKPCRLPAGVQADVRICFKQPVFAAKTVLGAVKRYAFLLTEEEKANGAVTCKAKEITVGNYKDADAETAGLCFTANRISTFSVVYAGSEKRMTHNSRLIPSANMVSLLP